MTDALGSATEQDKTHHSGPISAWAPRARAPVIMLAPFPPPLAGAHKNSALIRSTLEASGTQVVSLQTGVSRGLAHKRAASHLLRKAMQSFKNVVQLLRLRDTVASTYLVPDGGVGIWISAAYGLTLRLTRAPRVVIHYRNYSFFRRAHPAMRVLAGMLGDRATHVFLDETMRERFTLLYGAQDNTLVVSNAATCDVTPAERTSASPEGSPIRVGYLSNLTNEKGFDIVGAAFLRLDELCPDIEFSIGGNPVGPDEALLLERLQKDLGPKLTYHGQVQGLDKQAFFESLDIFVFPTVYKQEAQPNVIFEALASGSFVIATRHAAIPGMFGAAPHNLIDVSSGDLVSDLVNAVQKTAADFEEPARRAASHRDTVKSFLRLQAEAKTQLSALITLLSGR